MADVRLMIANREYIVTCENGEESRLLALGSMVDDMAREAGGPTGGMNESRLLLFASLLLADKLHDIKNGAPNTAANLVMDTDQDASETAQTLEKLADRLEKLADNLEQ